jgi:hypothetical protein
MPDRVTRNEQATSAFDVLLSRRCQKPELQDAVDPESTIGMIFWATLGAEPAPLFCAENLASTSFA